MNKLIKIIKIGLFLFILYKFLFTFVNNFFLRIAVGPFDDALRLITLKWSYLFTPYKDFGFVYPPGYILINQLVNAQRIPEILQWKLIIYLLILLFILFIFYKFFPLNIDLFFYSLIILIFDIELIRYTWGDIISTAITISLLSLIIIYFFIYYKKNKIYKHIISILLLFLTMSLSFFRWDTSLIIISSFLFIILYILVSSMIYKRNINLKIVINLFLLLSLGYLIFLILLIFYLNYFNAFKEGLEFIFKIPIVISKNFPKNYFNLSNLFIKIAYILILLRIIIFIKRLLTKKSSYFYLIKITLAILPFTFLPYYFSHPDEAHIFHFILFSSFIFGLEYLITKKIFYKIIYLLLSFLPLFIIFRHHIFIHGYNFHKFSYQYNSENPPVLINLENEIENCKNKVIKLKFKSIFLGKDNYEGYYNYGSVPLVYFINPNIKPATRFISDEMGIQISCLYGEIITEEIKKAEKPLLALIETRNNNFENNKKNFSCKKIETFLKNNKYQKIGNCHSFNHNFEIRLYK